MGKGRVIRDLVRGLEDARREIRVGQRQRSMAVGTGFAALARESAARRPRPAVGVVIRELVRGLEDARREIRVGHLQRSMAVVTGFAALASERAARRLLPALGVVTLVDGVLGFLYHIRGIRRMPGGFSLGRYNIVMGPPVFAPLLMCTVGTTGLLTGVVRREGAGRGRQGYRRRGLRARIARGKFQRVMAAVDAGYAIMAGGEAYFEHLRGSFNQWVMWTPVIVTPPMVAAGIGAMMSEGIEIGRAHV